MVELPVALLSLAPCVPPGPALVLAVPEFDPAVVLAVLVGLVLPESESLAEAVVLLAVELSPQAVSVASETPNNSVRK